MLYNGSGQIPTKLDSETQTDSKLRVRYKVKYREEIVRWLSPPDPLQNHERARALCETKTGLWFTHGASFETWKTQESSFLWLYGIPGCGKTILSSTIIEDVLTQYENRPGIAVAYLYFDFNDIEKQGLYNLVCSLLAQLSRQSRCLSKRMKDLYEGSKGQSRPTLERGQKTLLGLLAEFDHVYILLDALDEMTECRELETFLKSMRTSYSQLHTLATSRKERRLELFLNKMASECIDMQSTEVNVDIQRHIESQLTQDPVLSTRPPYAKDLILEHLMARSQGMFRWVTCQLDVLRECLNIASIEDALVSLPATLDETYARTLLKIPNQHSRLAIRILQWLVFSKRPMLVIEIAELLVADPDSQPEYNSKRRLFHSEDILNFCGNLVATQDAALYDREYRTRKVIRLAHFSVQEFLLSDRIRQSKCAAYTLLEQPSHVSITRTCLVSLMELRLPMPSASERKREIPLVDYAAKYWTEHAKVAGNEAESDMISRGVQFLQCEPARQNWIRICGTVGPSKKIFRSYSLKADQPLYYASLAGMHGVVQALLDGGADINAQSGNDNRTALHAASGEGHESIVQLLLDRGGRY